MTPKAFTEYRLKGLRLKNRIVRAATYEGAADINGYPGEKYLSIYKTLAENNIGMIITGFTYISENGRAMQQAQSGIENIEKIESYKKVTDEVHKFDCPIILQISHSGRQTLKSIIKTKPVSSTNKASVYFRQKPQLMTKETIKTIVGHFINSAYYAREAGFDGIQLHAGHGYLLNQFLLPETNILKNEWGVNNSSGLGVKILDVIFDGIKQRCGESFPVMIKISGNHDLSDNFFPDKFDNLVKFIDNKKFDALEISYGTMDYPLNIFRGDLDMSLVIRYNPLFKSNIKFYKLMKETIAQKLIVSKFKEFKPTYNAEFAKRAKMLTDIPVISVGGYRSKKEIVDAINSNITDLVSLSRPLICQSDFVTKMMYSAGDYKSECINCNKCVFMCDSGRITTCYKNNSIIKEK